MQTRSRVTAMQLGSRHRFVPDRHTIDANLYLFALCRQLQIVCLDSRGIDCLVDVEDAGRLPEDACRLLGSIVSQVVAAASRSAPVEARPHRIAVTVRRHGTTCVCAIAFQGLADPCAAADRLSHLPADLEHGLLVRILPEHGVVAVMFDAARVVPGISALPSRF